MVTSQPCCRAAPTIVTLGSFAESATYIRQHRVAVDGGGSGMRLQLEVGTGELAPDARFAPHGHVVLINVDGVS